jgi:hypothetical protein
MKKLILAALITGATMAHASAADQYTAVKDTVGNCSAVVAGSPHYPGMQIMGDKSYASLEEANKSLDSLQGCSGFVR